MVIVGWSAISCEVLSGDTSVVYVGNEMRSHLITVLEQNMHTIIMTDEVR